MGWGDSIHSHTYIPIYFSAVVQSLKSTYPELLSGAEKARQERVCRHKYHLGK